jgi:hypothetical protein
MAETAADLVDHILPRVPVRQWVLSFPLPLRSLFAIHPELLAMAWCSIGSTAPAQKARPYSTPRLR